MTTLARRGAALSVCFALAAALAALVSAAAAPAAAPPKERVGGRINLILGTPTQFQAGEPFHVSHGWGPESGVTDADAIGRYRFELEVDGVRRDEDFVERSVVPGTGGAPDRHTLFWTFNVPEGMTGTHTFTGRWYAPCAASGQTNPCDTPTTPVEALTRTFTVEFARTNLALGKSVTASNEYTGIPSAPSLAVDGSWWTYWNSGNFPPQWIEVDLGAVQTVGEVRLGITQLPNSPTIHSVFGRSSTSEPWMLLQTFDGYTVDQQVLTHVAPTPQQLRFIRVETTSSWSWVAWREIEVYGPGG